MKFVTVASLLICITFCYSLPRGRSTRAYGGGSISHSQLNNIRSFNKNIYNYVDQNANYRQVRQAMNEYGLKGSHVHVGHIIPNKPGTGRYNGPEDRARNLMAQPASDNILLGHNRVSRAEMKYYGRN